MSSDGRLEALERRVNNLEVRLTRDVGATPQREAMGSDALWALEGLRERTEGPGAILLAGHVQLPDGRLSQWQESADTDSLLDEDWTDAADVLAALGNGVRLRLLRRILEGACSVNELTEVEGVGTSGQVYHHLRQLTAAGWLRAIGGGRHEVPVARVVPLLALILGTRR